jgi:hypothetical protein
MLIGEAKWGRKPLSRNLLTDLVQRSQRMPQVQEGWQTQYALFARDGFTDALQAYANSMAALLITLDQIEGTLGEMQEGKAGQADEPAGPESQGGS